MSNKWEEPRETGCLTITFILGLIVSIIMISSCKKKEQIFEDRSFSKHTIDISNNNPEFATIDFRGMRSDIIPGLLMHKEYHAGPHNWVNGVEVMLFWGNTFQNLWYEFDSKGICNKIIIHNSFDRPSVKFENNVIHHEISYFDTKIIEYIID